MMAPRGKHRVRLLGASGHNISPTIIIVLVYVCFCLETSYLISIVDSLLISIVEFMASSNITHA